MLTALTQPSPEALREAIRDTRHRIGGREGKFVSHSIAVNRDQHAEKSCRGSISLSYRRLTHPTSELNILHPNSRDTS